MSEQTSGNASSYPSGAMCAAGTGFLTIMAGLYTGSYGTAVAGAAAVIASGIASYAGTPAPKTTETQSSTRPSTASQTDPGAKTPQDPGKQPASPKTAPDTLQTAEQKQPTALEKATELQNAARQITAPEGALTQEKTDLSAARTGVSEALKGKELTTDTLQAAQVALTKAQDLQKTVGEAAKDRQERKRNIDEAGNRIAAPDGALTAEKKDLTAAVTRIADAFKGKELSNETLRVAQDALTKAQDLQKTVGEAAKTRLERKSKIEETGNLIAAPDGALTAEKSDLTAAVTRIADAFKGKELTEDVLKAAQGALTKAQDMQKAIEKALTDRLARKAGLDEAVKSIAAPKGALPEEKIGLTAAVNKIVDAFKDTELTSNLLTQAEADLKDAQSAQEKIGEQLKLRQDRKTKLLDTANLLKAPEAATPNESKPFLEAVKQVAVALKPDVLTNEVFKAADEALSNAQQEQKKVAGKIDARLADTLWETEKEGLKKYTPDGLSGSVRPVADNKTIESWLTAFMKRERQGVKPWTEANVQADIATNGAARVDRWLDEVWEQVGLVKKPGALPNRDAFWKYLGYNISGPKSVAYRIIREENGTTRELHLTVSGDSIPEISAFDEAFFRKRPEAIYQGWFEGVSEGERVHATREVEGKKANSLSTKSNEHIYLGNLSAKADTDWGGDAKFMKDRLEKFKKDAIEKIKAAKITAWKL